jgi:hypothetical protein
LCGAYHAEIEGVFLSAVPLDCNEGAQGDQLLEIALPSQHAISDYELIEDGKPYREWCVPARILNRYARTRRLLKWEEEDASSRRWRSCLRMFEAKGDQLGAKRVEVWRASKRNRRNLSVRHSSNKRLSLPNLAEVTVSAMGTEPKLSHLQRWIMVEAYKEIVKVGRVEPTRRDNRAWPDSTVHFLRIDVLRDYFHLPVRFQYSLYSGSGHWVIDTANVAPGNANAARTALTRSLRRLKDRGLISDSITLTARGIEVAKRLGKL